MWRILKKKIGLPYDLAILLLGIYLKKTKTFIQKDVPTTAKIWKQPKYPLIAKSTIEYY